MNGCSKACGDSTQRVRFHAVSFFVFMLALFAGTSAQAQEACPRTITAEGRAFIIIRESRLLMGALRQWAPGPARVHGGTKKAASGAAWVRLVFQLNSIELGWKSDKISE